MDIFHKFPSLVLFFSLSNFPSDEINQEYRKCIQEGSFWNRLAQYETPEEGFMRFLPNLCGEGLKELWKLREEGAPFSGFIFNQKCFMKILNGGSPAPQPSVCLRFASESVQILLFSYVRSNHKDQINNQLVSMKTKVCMSKVI